MAKRRADPQDFVPTLLAKVSSSLDDRPSVIQISRFHVSSPHFLLYSNEYEKRAWNKRERERAITRVYTYTRNATLTHRYHETVGHYFVR